MSAEARTIAVEVAYALPHEQRIIAVHVLPGTTAREAVRQAGILAAFPLLNLETAVLGIFSRILDGKSSPLPEDYVLQAGDRVEIYRPLQLDPKQIRLLRATKATKARAAAQNRR